MHRGFTLFELLIVLGLLGAIASFSAVEGIGSFRNSTDRVGMNQATSLQLFARSKAMHHICTGEKCSHALPHGIHAANEITVFQGTSFPDRDADEDAVFPIKGTAGAPTDTVYFSNGEHSSF